MSDAASPHLRQQEKLELKNATLVLALSGWMDGGDVSTGTVRRLVDLLEARPIADIDGEPFYLYNFPGSMEITSLFRPHVKIEDGQVVSLDMPENKFFCHEPANLVLFLGKEPNLAWRSFGDAVVELAHRVGVQRILFVGSFGGAVPHTREPRLYVTCSDASLLPAMEQYGLRRTGYEGPGSFTSYLLTRAPTEGLEMTSLVAEIPGYLQGRNPMSIEAVTRRLAKILKLPLDLQTLREESTEWELQVSKIVAKDKEMAKTVRQLEEAYDNELLEMESDEPAAEDEA
jgi:proteasome assembly chaperone (PAC2) family protein